jgi:hypothetical protein
MTPLRTALQKEAAANLEFGEAILSMLKRKAESQLAIIAPAHDEQLVEILRALVDMHVIQNRLSQERHRLSVVNSYRIDVSGRH